MRIRSDIFVSAIIRRVFADGGFAAVEHKGADASGAVFVRQRFRDGLETLYGPAPQSVFDDEASGERLFECRLERAAPDDIAQLLARERKFDSDLWIVEIETDRLGDLLPLAGPAG